MVKLQNIKSTIATFPNVSIIAKPSDIIKICGDNGSGKTTLLKIISGLTPNYTGEVVILSSHNYNKTNQINRANHNIHGDDEKSIRNSKIVAVFAQNALQDDLTVEENINIMSQLESGINLSPAAIEFFGLHQFCNTKICHASSGTARKTALSRLLVCLGDIWIIDEAESCLDENSRIILKGLIETKASQGGIVFFTSQTDYMSDIASQTINLKASASVNFNESII